MKRVRMVVKGELKEFTRPNTERGVEKRGAALARLGVKPETTHVPKYIKRNGKVYKMVNGVEVELKKVA